jgi:predicted SAM-dependent methyltransferase
VHSSHLLEHLPDWVGALNLWSESIKSGGVLFIYLPDKSQRYWNPFNNRKHMSCFYPEIIKQYLVDSGMYKNIFVSGVDAYNSFTAFAEKI